MIGRRIFLLGASTAAIISARKPESLLDRSIRRLGGATALRHARVLQWQGEATIYSGDRRIDIGVSTRVEPFVAARSDSWLLSDGPTKTRSLIIEPDGGWIERDGTRAPMSDAMLRHERAQYAIYGLMLLVSLHDSGASGLEAPAPNSLLAHHPGAPDTIIGLDERGDLAWATNTVPNPEGDGVVAQRFSFSNIIRSRGVRWPARIQIAHNSRPYFDLRLSHFHVSN